MNEVKYPVEPEHYEEVNRIINLLLSGHKELLGKNTDVMQEMIFKKGINWNNYDSKYKRGRMIIKETYEKESEVIRTRWISIDTPIFTQERKFISEKIPDSI